MDSISRKRQLMTTIVASLLVSMSFFMILTIGSASAASNTTPVVSPNNLPAPLPGDQVAKATQIALSNSSVISLINGRPYKFMTYDQIGNVFIPGSWHPEVYFNVNNTSEITVEVDLQKAAVIQAFETPLTKVIAAGHKHTSASDPPGFALDYYSGSSTLNGIEMKATAPSYNTADGNANTITAFLVNALESGGRDDQAFSCNSQYWTTDYFGQSGFAWMTTVKRPIWSDTVNTCTAMNPGLAYNTGDLYEFEVYTNGGYWYEFGWDTVTGAGFSHSQSGVSKLTFNTNDINTSVWFENDNLQGSTSWVNKYSSTSLSATAKYSSDNAGTWNNWQSDHQSDLDCHNVLHTPSQAISNTLASGLSATWNLSTVSTVDYAC